MRGDYKRIDVLKSRVLEPSIKQINEHTDIIVSVAQHKTGRSVTGFHSDLNKNRSQK